MHKKCINEKEMYGLIYLILLKNTIYDMLDIALVSSLHIKIQYTLVNKIFEKLLVLSLFFFGN